GNFGEVKPVIIVAVPRVFLKVYAGVEKLMAGKPAPIRWLYRRGLAVAKRRAEGAALRFVERMIFSVADRLVLSKIRARFGGRLKFAVSGAAALPREAAELIDGLGIGIYEGYGLTETSPVVAANVPGHRKMGSVGRPLPGVRVVIDRTASKDGDPTQGEIIVYGPNVTRGYHNSHADNVGMFTADGGLRTGDLGYLDADNYLFITGRIKEQYKLANGKYVVPGPLEDRLKLSPFVSNVMVYGDNKPFNVALIVLDAAAVAEWAAKEGIAITGAPGLAHDPRVRDKISAEIDVYSSGFRGYERIRAFALIDDDFTQDNDMLTPTLKLKRRKVVSRWGVELERLCQESIESHSRDGDHLGLGGDRT
ncbi:MAG TPA: AMP-binding protein, partial [Polyangia bacterium]|nr:AMP-binding protein [Polyangia bacterium]